MWFKQFLLILLVTRVSSFTSLSLATNGRGVALSENTNSVAEAEVDKTASLVMPLSYSEMVRQVASAMRDAYDQKMERQIVRVLLPRDTSSEQLGVLNEGIMDVDSQNIILVPPDESWQGGIMQLYYSAAPTCRDALRYVETANQAPNGRNVLKDLFLA
jgi:hypothetical protein